MVLGDPGLDRGPVPEQAIALRAGLQDGICGQWQTGFLREAGQVEILPDLALLPGFERVKLGWGRGDSSIHLHRANGRRQLGQNGWKVIIPSGRLTVLQILIGVVDLGFCALAMYLLMPATPYIDFLSLAVVFILATLLGFASHAPGSLGVFDAAMLVALPQFGKEQLLATLLVFRVLYFVIPFTLAISIMGTRELWLSVVRPWQMRRRCNGGGQAARAAVVRSVNPGQQRR